DALRPTVAAATHRVIKTFVLDTFRVGQLYSSRNNALLYQFERKRHRNIFPKQSAPLATPRLGIQFYLLVDELLREAGVYIYRGTLAIQNRWILLARMRFCQAIKNPCHRVACRNQNQLRRRNGCHRWPHSSNNFRGGVGAVTVKNPKCHFIADRGYDRDASHCSVVGSFHRDDDVIVQQDFITAIRNNLCFERGNGFKNTGKVTENNLGLLLVSRQNQNHRPLTRGQGGSEVNEPWGERADKGPHFRLAATPADYRCRLLRLFCWRPRPGGTLLKQRKL